MAPCGTLTTSFLNAAISIIFFVIFSVVFLSLLGWVGLWLVVLFGFVFLVGFAMSVAWAHRAVTEFHGSPFPGIWGVLGSNIEPDDNSPEPRFLSSGRSMWDSPEVRKAEAPVEPATASLAAPRPTGSNSEGPPRTVASSAARLRRALIQSSAGSVGPRLLT